MICSMIYITLTFSQCQFPTQIQPSIFKETVKKRVQDTSCKGVSPSFKNPPRLGDIGD